MKIGLRVGHSPNCRGGKGVVDEWEEMNKLYPFIYDLLKLNGIEVVNCSNSESNVNSELAKGCYIANSNNVDLFISLHMNCFNGNANGTECWTYSEKSRANDIAKRINSELVKRGFSNRGIKYNSKYYEMRYVNAPNIILETCFCDSKKDVSILKNLGQAKMAYSIVKGILGKDPIPNNVFGKGNNNVIANDLIQRILGVYNDGVFGVKTDSAVKKYQKNHNIGQDGKVGIKTFSSMLK